MNFFRDLLWKIQGIFLLVWYLIIFVLSFLLIPILVFLPPSLAKNFDQIVNKAALKLLWIIWRVLKVCLLILFTLVIFLLGPILWPVYLGILVLRPRFAAYILSIKIF